ncbi:cytochrome P450 [Mycobacterium sp. CVI_P3]|uniref:Cytochrome P450 n=1 Tax=Mycobacterium pinniadriaticum TaxID=2994102 RepID=A0ABT3SMU2_9MYCO|nr:cytochrome P450 [Mycobacterium pinniadriaticum]MCX2934423.1 cytochrome P450 [Mycobacterium pinniadriaticum]MCX2940846.1 cytochrome P450 [Mycobacterium pinniadriaticum]
MTIHDERPAEPASRAAVTCPFDHHSAEIAADPYPKYAELRAAGGMTWTDAWGGFWVISSYDLVQRVALDDATFCSGEGVALPPAGQSRPLLPIESDPPRLQVYRKLLNPLFSPGAARRYQPMIESITAELVDGFIDRGEVDAAAEFAVALPARVTLRLLGMDDSRWEWFLERIHYGVHQSAVDLDRAVELITEVCAAIAEAYEQRVEEGLTGDDILSILGRAERDGLINDEEMLDMALLMLFGGLDTTGSTIASALYHLADRPAERERLLEDPDALDAALEEILRYEAPVQGLARTVVHDTELGGHQLKAGEKVWLLWASANRDPAKFADPEQLDLDRDANPHMSFGVGLHRCIGSNLARVIVTAALCEFIGRLPNYQLAPGRSMERYPDSALVFAISKLPITF